MSDIGKKESPGEFAATIDKYANDWKMELFALIGFCVSGVIFILSGIQSGDALTIAGSTVWIAACIIWMVPYRKYFTNSEG